MQGGLPKKKKISILLCLLLVFNLSACGTETGEVKNTETSIETTSETETEEAENTETSIETTSETATETEENMTVVEETVDEYSDEYYLEQAKLLGIADESYYDHLDSDMTNVEYFTMLKNAHDMQYGQDSNCYIDGWLYYMRNDWEGKEPITLGKIVDVTALADAVYFRGIERDFKSDFWGCSGWTL